MRRFEMAAAASVLVALGLLTPALCCGQDAPVVKPGEGPATKDPEPKPPAAEAPFHHFAGLLPFPGGKVKIGVPRTGDKKTWGFKELVAWSILSRMLRVEEAIESELSPAVGEHEQVLPPFFIGKYEVTNAQYHHFLQKMGRVEVVIPAKDQPGARTLEEISRQFLLIPMFTDRNGKKFYPVAVDWEGLYDLNEATLNPPRKEGEARPGREVYRTLSLRPGTRLVAYRYSVPSTWKEKVKMEDGKERDTLRDAPPPGSGDHPVTSVSLMDAIAMARYYGCHVPTEAEWEACAHGPKGEPWPSGPFDPLGMAWSSFNTELEKAKDEAKKKLARGRDKIPAEELARLDWVIAAQPFPREPVEMTIPIFPVGLFPLGKAPCGALDMTGNADEWVSTPLYSYPGTDTKSIWVLARSQILRGGNTLDRDIFLTAVIRKFWDHGACISASMKFTTSGFRLARYVTPGASAAFPAVLRLSDPDNRFYLPGEMDPKTRMPVFVGLDLAQAIGIERLDEVQWDPAGSPENDPTAKVFHLGPAFSLAMVPATGTPFKDLSALRRAGDRPVHDPTSGKPDAREPRDIPFFGLLHATPGMEVKAEVLVRTKMEVPLTGDKLKRATELFEAQVKAWEARRKEKEDAEKEKEKEKEGKEGGGEGGGDGGGDPPPKDGIAVPAPPQEGGTPKKGKPGEDPPPAGGDPAPGGGVAHEGDKDGKAAEEEEEEEEVDPRPVPITTETLLIPTYKPGFLKGEDHPNGLLVGMVLWGGEKRVVLWEPRLGTVPTPAPGGGVMLEPPIAILPLDCLDLKKSGRAGTPYSSLDGVSGEVKLVFFLPVEGKSDVFECTLKLTLGEFPAGSSANPWRDSGTPWRRTEKK